MKQLSVILLLLLAVLSCPTTASSARKGHTVKHTAKHSAKHSLKHTAKHGVKHTLKHSAKHNAKHTVKHTARSAAPADAYGIEGTRKYVTFPQSGVSIRQPQGFDRSDSFDGFSRPRQQASVIVLGVPGSLTKISAEFSNEQLSRKGWTLLDRQDITVSDVPGVLIHFEQPVGDAVFLKWALLFGDKKRTTIVMATAPKIYANQLSASLKECVLSTRIGAQGLPETGPSIPFTIEASPKLKPASTIGQTLLFSKDGTVQKTLPEDPVFVAAFSATREPISNQRKFAERRLKDNYGMKRISKLSSSPVTINGLEGIESLASAVDAKSGTPLMIYQVMLFEKSRYILMQGIAGAALRDEYLPEFRAMAHSLSRKQP
jgi:hypothetical protein